MTGAPPVLSVAGLEAGYTRDLPILRGINLSLEAQSLTTIIGPNGAGKSTLIKAIAGIVPVSAGSIKLNDRDIVGIRTDQIGGLGLAYVPQNDNVFRSLTIAQNLLLTLRRAPDRKTRLAELYDLFPALAEKKTERAGSLSGGQRQMLAVAMALALHPRVILMDEPSAGLSPKVAQDVLGLARQLTREGVSILLVEQNVKQALAVSDYCYVLAEGRNQVDGPADKILSDPVVGEIYLGGRRMA
ncbi:ABC transporter ATP-binding protein [Acuticoccus sp. MNP-M23]|uniref:ABC transporter ATP-binding protein n=1 Tax=Acuticoccus sp. MNP-M23 TaxID=3072793 RepID=UPI0028152C12|nr:ABC transporter ATP-binding protein [Acuticoccus sp. MNP-M23]WMS44628.1 ABC transporter ATP-binding protein [Acuticoccus sp. MNP-M23]